MRNCKEGISKTIACSRQWPERCSTLRDTRRRLPRVLLSGVATAAGLHILIVYLPTLSTAQIIGLIIKIVGRGVEGNDRGVL